MKELRRAISFLCVLVLLLVPLMALAEDSFEINVENGNPVSGYYELKQGDTLAITPVKKGSWSNAEVTWSSSNESVATVELGVVFASSALGTATITATANVASSGASTSRTISVKVLKADTAVSIRSTGGVTTVGKGATLQMIAEVTPTSIPVEWSSDNTEVATVNHSGLVKGVKAGKALITAAAQDASGARASMSITVKAVAEHVTLNKSSVELYIGGVTKALKKTAQLNVKVTPAGTAGTLTWDSNDESVVAVSAKGKLLAKKVGTATIRVTTENGLKASCKVTVEKLPTKLQLPKSKQVAVGNKISIPHKVDGTVTELRWRSSNTRVAKVQKGVVLGVKPGVVKIAARTVNGKTATCLVRVRSSKGAATAPDAISLETVDKGFDEWLEGEGN